MKVPFIDLQKLNARYHSEIHAAVDRVIASNDFAGGRFVEEFEREFAAYCECRHAVGVSSGTDALWLTLKALGIGPGDEVITVPNTFIATAAAIVLTGATPVFVDVDPVTYTMSPEALERAVTRRTRAVVPVHLFGHPAEMAAICEVASKFRLLVVEDACQAHGAKYRDQKVGSIGHAACFSFYPAKNLGALGDAGAVVTSDPRVAEKIRTLREHGQTVKNEHSTVGINARMSGIQAAILQVKLRHLDSSNHQRRQLAREYGRLLGDSLDIVKPFESKDVTHAYHLFVVRVANRDAVIKALEESRIGCGVHYPKPIHLQQAFRELGHRPGDFPVAEMLAKELLSLPMHPELTLPEVAYVTQQLDRVVSRFIPA